MYIRYLFCFYQLAGCYYLFDLRDHVNIKPFDVQNQCAGQCIVRGSKMIETFTYFERTERAALKNTTRNKNDARIIDDPPAASLYTLSRRKNKNKAKSKNKRDNCTRGS